MGNAQDPPGLKQVQGYRSISFKIDFYDHDTHDFKRSYFETEPSKLQLGAQGHDTDDRAAIQVVTSIFGVRKSDLRKDDASSSAPPPVPIDDSEDDDPFYLPRFRLHRNTYQPPENVEDIHVKRIAGTKLYVYSKLLMQLLRSVITYYPSQDLTGDFLVFAEPYAALVHYLPQLQNTVKQCNVHAPRTANSHSAENPPEHDTGTVQHLKVLLEYLEPFYSRSIAGIQAKLDKPTPVITWNNLWLLYKPGQEVYIDYRGKWRSGIVMDAKRLRSRPENDDPRQPSEPRQFGVRCWNLSSDGDEIGRKQHIIRVEEYEGEREVTLLPVYPCSMWDQKDNNERKSSFEKRGKLYFDILRAGHKEMLYNGSVTMERRVKKYTGKVIVDIASSGLYSDLQKTDAYFPAPEIIKDYYVKPGTEGSKSDIRHCEWSAFEHLKAKDPRTAGIMTNLHYRLMTPVTSGFILKDKQWKLIDVGSLNEVPATADPLQYLVLDPKDLQLLKSLSHQQSSGTAWTPDFIQGKGMGQIVLLHGPPGVGKTYTVECIAESFGRSLLSLTVADLGMEEIAIEERLDAWFSLAEAWRAVLLIDEADVFLERRSRNDIRRNALVAVFLRKMEYFRGLLFLTTNRTGHIDDAFLSRIHVAISYLPLNSDKRKSIWEAFFAKLVAERDGHVYIDPDAKTYLISDKEVQDLEWNGRHIRNAFQTAIALAEYQAYEQGRAGREVTVTSDHFRRVVKMSMKFKQYMKSVDPDERDEHDRAYYQGDRNDRIELLG